MEGLVFDIKEFAIHDGTGIRTTVFLKGCPLRCIWCHNPEGLLAKRELSIKKNGCLQCGLCLGKCNHPDCQGLGRCLHICPKNLISVAGTVWDSEALARKLLLRKAFYELYGGGITLSGGEPLLQADFCTDLLGLLKGKIHLTVETSGYADAADFQRVAELCDMVIMDLKLADTDQHLEFTGVHNDKIIANALWLKESGKKHLFRIPLIPGITDSEENLSAISKIAGDSPVELLPYNKLAPAKYSSVGRKFTDRIDERAARAPRLSIFSNAKMRE